MKSTVISIYPDCNGQMLVSACKQNTEIKFVTNKKNLFYLITITQLKILKRTLIKRLSHI